MTGRALILLFVVGLWLGVSAARADENNQRHFATKVWPLLAERCLACHGKDPEQIKGGLDLRTLSAARRGGDSGEPAIIAGQPEASPLVLSALRTHEAWEPMPPKENDRLSDEQLVALREWIRNGADWPEPEQIRHLAERPAAGLITVSTSGGLDRVWDNRGYRPEDLWAYRPLRRNQPPTKDIHPIDAFINARLPAAGLQPTVRADPRSLLRRATIDLTGLPPTPSAVATFLADQTDAEAGWSRLLDRLLASERYGEQMARHWLDVVRYADTAGFSNDFERPNAWRYRDYVIRAFNRDLPYDRFIREQIAGDELPDGGVEGVLATGFLRMGPWEHLGMAVEAETRQQWLDDTVNIVGNAFLGLELSCVKCHDHKFDPLPTRDYYSLQAVFAGTQPADVRAPFTERESRVGFERRQATEAFAKTLKANGRRRIAGLNRKTIERRVLRWPKSYQPVALSVYNGAPRTFNSTALNNFPPDAEQRGNAIRTVNILGGGSLAAPLAEVRPGTLSAANSLSDWNAPPIPATLAGRRLALADWIADARNPFTARVIVNRVWGWHFGGRPLVATPNSFGVKGARPSHPELLDWLAAWFIEHDWSGKQLHRLIMTSEAYRRSIEIPAGIERDAAHKWLAAFPVRRLAAEELRDAMLQAAGELNLAAGGPPARPQMNWDAALSPVNVQSGIDMPYRPDRTPAERNRRSVYAYHMRSRRDPLLEVFNQPGSERSCELRGESIVVAQAFTLLNGDFANDRAIAMADRLARTHDAPSNQIDAAFGLALGRPATKRERTDCLQFLVAQTTHHTAHPAPRSEVRERVAAVSRHDPAFAKSYQPDLQAADVAPPTRALADLCLTLFNTSEFLYLP